MWIECPIGGRYFEGADPASFSKSRTASPTSIGKGQAGVSRPFSYRIRPTVSWLSRIISTMRWWVPPSRKVRGEGWGNRRWKSNVAGSRVLRSGIHSFATYTDEWDTRLLSVGWPMSRKSRDMGHPRYGWCKQKST